MSFKNLNQLETYFTEHLKVNLQTNGCMKRRAILAPTNNQVNQINDLLADMFPGYSVVLLISVDLINPNDFQRYNNEYLYTLSPKSESLVS